MKSCPNCGAPVPETYCGTCGQKYESERFSLSSLVSTFLAELVDAETGLLATLIGLSRAPGRVIRDYWGRRTRPYMNPTRYFLFTLTILQLVFWQTGSAGAAVEGWQGAIDEGGQVVSRAEGLRFLSTYFVLFFASGLPVAVIATGWGTVRNVAERTIFHLYTTGHIALQWSLLLLLEEFLPVPTVVFEVFFLAAPVVYYTWIYVGAHRPDTGRSVWREAVQALGAVIVFVVLYLSLFIAGIVVYQEVAGPIGA